METGQIKKFKIDIKELKQITSKYPMLHQLELELGLLPQAHSIIILNGRTFYYHYGVFYMKNSHLDEYEVVKPIVGVRVDALPLGCTLKSIDGVDYYMMDSTYFKAVVDENGILMFEVVSTS